MFFAHGALSVADASLRTHLTVDRNVRAFAVERRGLIYDGRILPALQGSPRDMYCLYIVLEGTLEFTPVDHVRPADFAAVHRDARATTLVRRGQGLLMREEHLDGTGGRRKWGIRTYGEPFRLLEIRVRGAGFVPSTENLPRAIDVPGPSVDQVDTHVRTVLKSPTEGRTSIHLVYAALVAHGLVSTALAESIVLEEDPRVERMWNSLAASYRSYDTQPTLKAIASASDMSLRTLSRFLALAGSELLHAPLESTNIDQRGGRHARLSAYAGAHERLERGRHHVSDGRSGILSRCVTPLWRPAGERAVAH